MSRAALLLELGCEEIPARMIDGAVEDLARRLCDILDKAGLEHGAATPWGGSRRLAVRIEAVAGRQQDRDEELLGPPVSVGLNAEGQPSPAAIGFAKKQGIDPADLAPVETPRGSYLGVRRRVEGRSLEAILAEQLATVVAQMSFPKTMRWADGTHRWVRPLHWIVALHGAAVLDLSVFGIRSGRASVGHRFSSSGPVAIASADNYVETLRGSGVIVEPGERRELLERQLQEGAARADGRLVTDSGLLDEIAHLVETPGVVLGRFEERFLELPRELLITTLRHHQKCFSVDDGEGCLRPAFMAVANMQGDPAGHVQRGNEWVVGGRLEDARFFWSEDCKQGLARRWDELRGIVVHAKIGHYADKSERVSALAQRLAQAVGLDEEAVETVGRAGRLAKIDLVTGTVGEFPELQGRVGGLLLEREGDAAAGACVYSHYQPEGPDDPVPPSAAAAVVALADKLESTVSFVSHVERPTGSRDPFGLRRATNGLFRILVERSFDLSIVDLLRQLPEGMAVPLELAAASGDKAAARKAGREAVPGYLAERLQFFLRERGATQNEIQAVLRPRVREDELLRASVPDLAARLDALQDVRDRSDFDHLVDLTKRVDNILTKNAGLEGAEGAPFEETEPAAVDLQARIGEWQPQILDAAERGDYAAAVERLAGFIAPVDRFFEDVLVIDADQPAATASRYRLLGALRDVLTAHFDIRELAGQAERKD